LRDPVVAIHCKAGKGRTGLIIVCWLLYTELFDNVEDAIKHYDETRTQNNKALTIPSQIRAVYHFK
jgi:phosphatidylinositol-3,4,5-trisphosphate 3-phosphatase/dual-specificity protein phosphatase PTEN